MGVEIKNLKFQKFIVAWKFAYLGLRTMHEHDTNSKFSSAFTQRKFIHADNEVIFKSHIIFAISPEEQRKKHKLLLVTYKSKEMENVFPLNLAHKSETRHLRLKLFKL